ncbi:MAG TPA: GlsB/YeaQ/YmgE family stress response membrane protein [Terriglobales bacterium]|nr:GlsB/YeaQ/YmgE family stress response membrane protein [Terriglobales bacterium]
MLELIWIVIIGAIVGALAKLLMPGDDPGGFIITALIGIAGAMIATFLGRALGWYQPDEAAGFIASVVGAILILFAYNRLKRPGRSPSV